MLAVAILAAGQGTRMKSRLPKVLHDLGGHSLLERSLACTAGVAPARQIVVVGYEREWVQQSLDHLPHLEFVQQTEQRGTGHAVQQLIPHLQGFQGDVLVLNGDVPLLRTQTLELLLKTHREHHNAATLLTAQLSDAQGYGRVFCNQHNIVTQIVEDRDCTPGQRQNRKVNAGIYCFNWSALAEVLPKLRASNAQQEYYLTDTVSLLSPVMAVDVEDYQEILGINDRQQLSIAYGILQTRIKNNWMAAGVTLVDPSSITIDEAAQIASDVVIEPQTHIRGTTKIASGCRIGPGSLIENSEIGENTTILYSVVVDSIIQPDGRIGPYTHLRGQVQVGKGCRVGNFVELKNSKLGDRTNVAHLSYLGDTTVGERVNVGAGTITANYDGVKKHPTVIGDRTKTGANSVLVAPITVGSDVTIAAGSTVTEDVADDTLVIARARQVNKPGWQLNPNIVEDSSDT
ncbi:MAG: bifunctional UDP-N-acetylglucosamine diphosphorylase/glucosamine-1-phosphate N-acetyltransferase GlmU [Leptolyngbyaceae cyanobacterium CRU_2_3]|nr:bifunctional UDP-N-acetylglucosamine diphosphorylase/glucosamine-1-phosphate N-acetyltransferase GlmU [Leptolyngbyaceae cyanobacterium CRU_2_3]